MTTDTISNLLTPKQAAAILGVKVHTLAVWRCNDRYPLPYFKVGNIVRYTEHDVRSFIKAQTAN